MHLLVGEELLHNKSLVSSTVPISIQVLLPEPLPGCKESVKRSVIKSTLYATSISIVQNIKHEQSQSYLGGISLSKTQTENCMQYMQHQLQYLGGIPLSVMSKVFAHCLIHSFLIAAIWNGEQIRYVISCNLERNTD